MATKKRLIDANALIEKARWMEEPDGNGINCDILAVSVYSIKDTPTVDAVEVVHGRWEEHPRMTGYLRCSKCHDANIWEDWLTDGKWNYCPNCGAKMDGDGNE